MIPFKRNFQNKQIHRHKVDLWLHRDEKVNGSDCL